MKILRFSNYPHTVVLIGDTVTSEGIPQHYAFYDATRFLLMASPTVFNKALQIRCTRTIAHDSSIVFQKVVIFLVS